MESSTGGKSAPLSQATRRLVDSQDLFFRLHGSKEDRMCDISCPAADCNSHYFFNFKINFVMWVVKIEGIQRCQ